MSVSYENSKVVFQGIKDAGIRSLSALPETWLGLLLQQAEKDPDVRLIQVAREEEAIGIAAGAYFAGERHILLMQNHGFLAAMNGIVSLAMLYGIPLCMLIALRGHWGEPYPWHTRGGIVTEGVLRALERPVRVRARSEGGRAADSRGLHVLAERPVAGRAAAHARFDGGGAVKRSECIAMLHPELDDKVVVTIMGACAQELYDLGHRENFFYLQHAMGLASSIGLGLALHLPREKVVVLDGDGSVLMNLGTLATLARYRPANLVHIIFDNGSLLSTGGFDSHTTSGITDLAAIARGAGIEQVAAVDTVMAFGEAVLDAFARNDLSVIVAKVAAVGPNHYGMDLQLPENAFRFKRWIAARKSSAAPAALTTREAS